MANAIDTATVQEKGGGEPKCGMHSTSCVYAEASPLISCSKALAAS